MQTHLARTTLSRALSAAILGMAASAAMAQEQPAPQAQAQAQPPQAEAVDQVTDLDSVVVKGFRRSLQYSTDAKRDATGFIDAIFAEDIGKFRT